MAKPRSMALADVAEFYRRLSIERPDPRSDLEYRNPYTLLVAVVLSAQATDAGVNRATRELFRIADSPGAMVKLGEAGLLEHIRTIGLFRNKAKNVIRLSQILVGKYHGKVPNDREALEALPGVGRKTANVVLNIAFGQPTIAVDTHIFRISNRTGLAPGKDVRAVEEALLRRTPDRYRQHAHHWLILHGRYTCKARAPACGKCVVRDLCLFRDKTKAT